MNILLYVSVNNVIIYVSNDQEIYRNNYDTTRAENG